MTILSSSFWVLAHEDEVDFSSLDKAIPIENIELFSHVFEKIKTTYVDKIGDEELLRYAIDGMFDGLDAHSSFLNSDQYRSLDNFSKGRFVGVGVDLEIVDGEVVVVAALDGSAAQKAGVQAGDVIVAIGGIDLPETQKEQVIYSMHGQEGTVLHLTLRRKDDSILEVWLTRSQIKVNSVSAHLLSNRIGYIRIASFTHLTGQQLNEQIIRWRDLDEGNIDALIIDLRNNAGGILQEAIVIADFFLESGTILITKSNNVDMQFQFNATSGDIINGKPMVVLMDGGTASASEVLAAALQDNRRAVLVGAPTFGKGSVQSISTLPSGEALKITTSRYYSPLGKSIDSIGLKPDHFVNDKEIQEVQSHFADDKNHSGSDALGIGDASLEAGVKILESMLLAVNASMQSVGN